MVPSFLLSLREGLEAALIIGIIFGVLHRIRREDFKASVWYGVGAAILLSLAFGLGLNLVGMEFEGQFEEAFEGIAMLLAAAVLTWMIFWMQNRGADIQRDLEAKTVQATLTKSASALFALAFLAVFREGVELALFLLATRMASDPVSVLVGAVLGLSSAIVLGWMLFATTRRLNLRQFFNITNILLLLFAAGLVALGVHELNEAEWIPTIVDQVWDVNHILSDASWFGSILKALFGYNGNPSLSEVIAYMAYFLIIGTVILRNQRKQFEAGAVSAQ
jgi:high-affinity iron transporter